MLQFNMSRHTKQDRINRLTKIATTIGCGDSIILSGMSTEIGRTDCKLNLSDTGIMFVTDAEGKYLITAYIPSVEEVAALEHLAEKKLTSKIWAKVYKNQKVRREINKCDEKR